MRRMPTTKQPNATLESIGQRSVAPLAVKAAPKSKPSHPKAGTISPCTAARTNKTRNSAVDNHSIKPVKLRMLNATKVLLEAIGFALVVFGDAGMRVLHGPMPGEP